MTSLHCTRREFLTRAGSCAAHIALMSAALPGRARASWGYRPLHPVVAQEPWGRLEQVADGIWAMVSTPLQDRTTLCNGGIVAGRSGVLMIESFASDEGARWLAGEARRLTGRAPTHVVLTHYHSDHTGGLTAAADGGGRLMATATTRDLIAERNSGAPSELLRDVQVLDAPRPTEIDLGGVSVLVVPRRGHTDSDVSVEVFDPSVVFCGDLVWNEMFPNYVDAIPSRLSLDVRLLRRDRPTTYVPGHGPLADPEALDRYLSLLDDVETAARRAIERGMTAEEAGEAYQLPDSLGEWTLFNPGYFARAIGRWMAEIEGALR